MFNWLWRRPGLSNVDGAIEIEYDVVYGLSKRALSEWLRWNPELKAEYQLLERAAQSRRNKAAGEQGDE